ncbi:MAG: hypothetical protein PWQ06_2811 [Anaerophaga sp.]|nr:hypothetical protein [Anaerophaga sp.]MDN5292572.1 hypothetical protein [Anaerophaga sp.]
MSKIRIFGLRKPCNRSFLNRHTYYKNFCKFIDTHYFYANAKFGLLDGNFKDKINIVSKLPKIPKKKNLFFEILVFL